MAVCPTCRSDRAENFKASFGNTIVCRMCDPIVDVVVISFSDNCAVASSVFARGLRVRGIRTQCDTRNVKPKKKFELASKLGAYYAVVIGDDELCREVVQVKDLDTKNNDPLKQVELSIGAAFVLLEYMLSSSSKVSGHIQPQKIIQVG